MHHKIDSDNDPVVWYYDAGYPDVGSLGTDNNRAQRERGGIGIRSGLKIHRLRD